MSSKPLPSFLQHVVDILETSESSASPCARWSDDGLSFVVLDTKRFSSEFLALHFKSAQFSSFVRQLNFYGFHKLACESKKTWEFKHECFIRGRPDLMHHIKRKTSAEYHSANKTEVTDLRAKVGQLTGQLGRSNAHFAAVMDLVKQLLPRERLSEVAVPEHVAEALRVGGLKGVASTGASNHYVLPAAGDAVARKIGAITTVVGAGAGAGAGTTMSAAAGSPTSMESMVQKRRRVDMESSAGHGTRSGAAPAINGRHNRGAAASLHRMATAPSDESRLSSPFDDEDEDEAARDAYGGDDLRAMSAGITMGDEEEKAKARAAQRAARTLAAAAAAAEPIAVAKTAGSVSAAPVARPAGGSARPRPESVNTEAPVVASDSLKSPLPGMDDIVSAFNNSLDFTGAGLPSGGAAGGSVAAGLGDTIRSASEMDFSWADVALDSPRGGAGAGASVPHHRRGSSLKLNGSMGSASMTEFLGSMPGLTPNPAADASASTASVVMAALAMSAVGTAVALASPRGNRTPARVL